MNASSLSFRRAVRAATLTAVQTAGREQALDDGIPMTATTESADYRILTVERQLTAVIPASVGMEKNA